MSVHDAPECALKYDLTTSLPLLDRLQIGGSVKVLRVNYDTASPLGNDSPYSPAAKWTYESVLQIS